MALENWTFQQNVHKHKGLLKDLRRLLTNEIQRRKLREPEYLDFRFLLPLAQWLCEQGGYTITPKGNNPGNVMGKGDVGEFHRADNVEIIDGKSVNYPANFARFSTMEAGTKATFDHLQERWFGAYAQILEGGSPEAYVKGLYPGRGKNYATQFQNVYTSGVRFRLGKIIEDYIAVYQDDLKDVEKELAVIQKNYNRVMQENSEILFGTDRQFGRISHNMDQRRLLNVMPKIEAGLQNQKSEMEKEVENRKKLLEEQINELKEIQKRFKEGKNLQPEIVKAANG